MNKNKDQSGAAASGKVDLQARLPASGPLTEVVTTIFRRARTSDTDACTFSASSVATPVAAVRGEAVAREYFYKVDACKADDGKSPECICWHKEGTGPLANRAHEVKHWRPAAPVSARAADAPSEQSEIAWRDQFWKLALALNCFPSQFIDANEHVFKAVESLKSRAADALDSQPTEPAVNYVRSEWESMCRKAVAVLNKNIVPDGISDHEALNELYGIFDSDEYRATGAIEQDACEARQQQQMSIDRTVAAMATISPASSQPTDGGVRNG